MHKYRLPPLGALVMLVIAAEAQAAGSGLGLKLDRELQPPPPAGNERLPVFIDADELRGHQERDFEARGAARFRTREKAVYADWLLYQSTTEEVEAAGSVRLEQAGDVFTGTRLKLNLNTNNGYLQQPTFTLGEQHARGDAQEFIFAGENRYRVDHGRYTTCGPGQDDWFIQARDLDLDRNTDVGTARDAKVVFMHTPILYTPWMDFPLSQNRKSGFLSPTFATSGKSGAEFSIPFYWNIAPNRDATFTPHILAKRGMMLGNEFRYLDPTYSGEVRAELLPGDQIAERDRWAMFMRHQQVWGPWSFLFNLQKASDDNYFRDLSTKIQTTSLGLLPRDLTAVRGGSLGETGAWTFSGFAQKWQTLQDPAAPITPPYNRLPQLTLLTNNYDILKTDIAFAGSYTSFDHPTLVNGRRGVGYPSVSLPLQTTYAYLTPKVGVHYTRYDLDATATTPAATPDRSVPIYSTEGGLVFERNTTIRGTEYLQTLEPRLMYLYIPTRNQNALPNFDSAQTDINFASIYAENQFSGNDRINDANQLTLGVTSRLLDPNTGVEQLRIGFAQRFYFKDQEVTLPGVAPRTGRGSDILAALSGRLTRDLTADLGVQYNNEFAQTNRFGAAMRYHPDVGRLLNASYRFNRNQFENIDLSAQWPITAGWTGVGRVNYSLRDGRIAEGLAGVEYNGGCWVVRLVTHTIAVGTGDASRSVFLQLELNGVARVGSNPLDVLKQNIAGYTKINEPSPSSTSILPPLR